MISVPKPLFWAFCMGSGFSRNQTASDIATLLDLAVPGFTGFYCYDRNGNKFCEHSPETTIESASGYTDALKQVLADPAQAPECGYLEVDDAAVFIVPFEISMPKPARRHGRPGR